MPSCCTLLDYTHAHFFCQSCKSKTCVAILQPAGIAPSISAGITIPAINHYTKAKHAPENIGAGAVNARGQEDQLGALVQVTNAVLLWNTLYMLEALSHQGGAMG